MLQVRILNHWSRSTDSPGRQNITRCRIRTGIKNLHIRNTVDTSILIKRWLPRWLAPIPITSSPNWSQWRWAGCPADWLQSLPHLIGHNGDGQAAQLIGYNYFLTLLATMAMGWLPSWLATITSSPYWPQWRWAGCPADWLQSLPHLIGHNGDGQATQLIGYNHFLPLLATMAMGRLPSWLATITSSPY